MNWIALTGWLVFDQHTPKFLSFAATSLLIVGPAGGNFNFERDKRGESLLKTLGWLAFAPPIAGTGQRNIRFWTPLRIGSHSCKGEWLPNLAVYMLIEQPLPVTLGSHSSESIVSRGSLEEKHRFSALICCSCWDHQERGKVNSSSIIYIFWYEGLIHL